MKTIFLHRNLNPDPAFIIGEKVEMSLLPELILWSVYMGD